MVRFVFIIVGIIAIISLVLYLISWLKRQEQKDFSIDPKDPDVYENPFLYRVTRAKATLFFISTISSFITLSKLLSYAVIDNFKDALPSEIVLYTFLLCTTLAGGFFLKFKLQKKSKLYLWRPFVASAVGFSLLISYGFEIFEFGADNIVFTAGAYLVSLGVVVLTYTQKIQSRNRFVVIASTVVFFLWALIHI